MDLANGRPQLVAALALRNPDETTPMVAEVTGLKLAFNYLYAMHNEETNVKELSVGNAFIRQTADGRTYKVLVKEIWVNLNLPGDGLYIQPGRPERIGLR